MMTEFVTINNVPVRVDSFGGYLPNKILEDEKNKPKELILVVPGNPGVTKFYESFGKHLHEKSKKPVWIVSHGGHDKTNWKYPPLKKNKELYDLKGQVKQKKELIDTYLKGVKLYCVGHSIGCKMLLDILSENDSVNEIEKCYLLFPTLERMAETPNGKVVTFVIDYILWLTLFGSWLFVNLPYFVRIVLLRIYCSVAGLSTNNIPSILELIDPHVLSKVFFLAHDEMINVRALDDEPFKKNGDKLQLYYGATDGWTPLNYYEELKAKHKEVRAEVCKKGYKHAFVLNTPIEVADLVCEWMTL